MDPMNARHFRSIRAVALVGLLGLPLMPARGQENPPREGESSQSRPRPSEDRGDRAEERDDRPERPRGERRDGPERAIEREGRPDRFDRPRFRPMQLPTEKEWQATVEFMEAHAPNMSRRIADSGDTLSRPTEERLKSAAFAQYRSLRDLERDNAVLYEVKLKLLMGRDALFGLQGEVRQAEEDKVADIREKIRAQMRQMVELSFQERELRLADLEDRLNSERERLTKDRGRIDEIAEKRFNDEIGKDPRPESVLPGEGPPGGSPPHRGPPDGPPDDRPRNRERDGASDDKHQPTTQPTAPH